MSNAWQLDFPCDLESIDTYKQACDVVDNSIALYNKISSLDEISTLISNESMKH